MGDLSHQGDAISLPSESNISLCSEIDMEVPRTNQSHKISTIFFKQDGKKQKVSVHTLIYSYEYFIISLTDFVSLIQYPTGCIEDMLIVEPAIATLEQPSPVSVLDATFYRDESPSPVKKILNAFEGMLLVHLA